MNKSASLRWILAVGLIAGVAAAVWAWQQRDSNEAPRYRMGAVERGSLIASISATGTLSPVTSVQVGTQVSGQIKELFVDFNSQVKKGQLVARIDPETFEYRVRQSQADTEAARSALGRAQVSQINAQRELARTRELVARNFVSPADLDRAQAQFDLAAADVKNGQAVVAQREASLASARVDLGRTEIRAPVDGVVIKRSVDVGQTVAASLSAPELFVIARDLRDMQVETSIDEADVGRIKLGQRASFTVDAFPGRNFAGDVKQIRKSAQNVQNVVTYTVLITAQNDGGQLMPGMTANVRIVTDTRDSALKVPNGALRFRPSGEGAAPSDRGNADKGFVKGSGERGGQLRERLIGELRLDAQQTARLEPILSEMRNRMMGLRDVPEEQRGKAAAAIRGDVRAQIETFLNAEQKTRYAEIVAELAGGRGSVQATRGRIWVLEGGKPKPIDVRIGLSDGTTTEVNGEDVNEGLQVIVGAPPSATTQSPSKGTPPRIFF